MPKNKDDNAHSVDEILRSLTVIVTFYYLVMDEVCTSDEVDLECVECGKETSENKFHEASSTSDTQGSIVSSSIDLKHLFTNPPSPGELINSPERCPVISESAHQQQLFSKFQAWALKNYGETGKTKTVTRSKYRKVINILKGVENAITENSKLRFWVKAKGFRLGRGSHEFNDNDREVLYIPAKNSCCLELGERSLKRVAVVEDFFEIIYNVHVEMDGRGGKHAGQKRTYRAIAETYAFLPREAVTKFLMSCADCQKRMHFSIDNVEQKLLGQSSPIKHSKTEAHDQGQTKYRRSLKRLKAGFEPPSADQQTSDDYEKSNIANYFAHKKFKVEPDHVTTNYNSKRTWIQSGSGLTSSSQEVDHPGLAELRSSCSEDRSSHSNVPLDLSTSKQNITQPKKEAPACPFHHDFGGSLTENPVSLIGDDVPMEQQLSERSLEIVAHNTPGKQLLPFFSSRYLSSPFISNFFFQNFCASTYKSSFSAVGTNKFNLIPEFLSNDNFHRNMFRTYHFEESSHLQISPREVSGLSFPKLSNLRQILSLPQLIAGYRDSASFLRRSADELECFLQRTV